ARSGASASAPTAPAWPRAPGMSWWCGTRRKAVEPSRGRGCAEDKVRRLRPGMTLAEVEALLGGPAADTFEMRADYPAYRWQREWREGGEIVVVQFTADGQVMSAAGQGRPSPGLSRVRAWPGW